MVLVFFYHYFISKVMVIRFGTYNHFLLLVLYILVYNELNNANIQVTIKPCRKGSVANYSFFFCKICNLVKIFLLFKKNPL